MHTHTINKSLLYAHVHMHTHTINKWGFYHPHKNTHHTHIIHTLGYHHVHKHARTHTRTHARTHAHTNVREIYKNHKFNSTLTCRAARFISAWFVRISLVCVCVSLRKKPFSLVIIQFYLQHTGQLQNIHRMKGRTMVIGKEHSVWSRVFSVMRLISISFHQRKSTPQKGSAGCEMLYKHKLHLYKFLYWNETGTH